MNFTKKQTLIQINKILLSLSIYYIFLAHFIINRQFLLIVNTIYKNWGLRRFIFQNIIYD